MNQLDSPARVTSGWTWWRGLLLRQGVAVAMFVGLPLRSQFFQGRAAFCPLFCAVSTVQHFFTLGTRLIRGAARDAKCDSSAKVSMALSCRSEAGAQTAACI